MPTEIRLEGTNELIHKHDDILHLDLDYTFKHITSSGTMIQYKVEAKTIEWNHQSYDVKLARYDHNRHPITYIYTVSVIP